MGRPARFLRKLLLAIGVWIVLLFVAYGVFAWWDIHRVREFCGEIKAGQPLSALPALAARHWLPERRVTSRIEDDDHPGNWISYMPVSATMGDDVCEIRSDDRKLIISAEMRGELSDH